jgi:hypothetical protein
MSDKHKVCGDNSGIDFPKLLAVNAASLRAYSLVIANRKHNGRAKAAGRAFVYY